MSFDELCKLCYEDFLKDEYKGIGHIQESELCWIFSPKIEEREYGTLPIIVFKDNPELPLYLTFEVAYDHPEYLKNAKDIDIPSKYRG